VETTAYLSLGSNVGKRKANLRSAIEKLGELGKIAAVSSFYETEPMEFTAQPWFLNCAVEIRTELTSQDLLIRILAIEQQMGRHRRRSKGPRNIDIDILLFGDSVIDTPQLQIPHPAMHERRFVLEPLTEIAPDVKHSLLKKTARELLQVLPPDAGKVTKASNDEAL
jgi:2-amino-4-hydroxy-6-hydroxymethyldihydropteridine diphosphokinase